nr:uncharacterized protein LOC121123737 isoform X2 [Lepeophtheirus salmonis]
MAEPLIKDSQNVFPSTEAEISHVCNNLFPRTWSDFIACVKKYTDNCLNNEEKTDFNRAVGDSINVVHRMCTNEDYKKDYMTHAHCIRDRATSQEHCGRYYQNLLEKISSATSTPSEICCAHSKFKYCVLKKTEYCQCDSNQKCSPNPIEKSKANTFAKATLEKALGFLLKQCDAVGFEDCSTSVENKQPRVIQTGGHEDFDGYFPSGPRTTKESNPKSATTSTTTSTTSPVVSSFSPSFIDDNVGQSTVATVSEIIPQNIINSLDSTTNRISYASILPNGSDKPTPLETDRSRPTPWLPQTEIKDFDDFFEENDFFEKELSAQELELRGDGVVFRPTFMFLTSCLIFILYLK